MMISSLRKLFAPVLVLLAVLALTVSIASAQSDARPVKFDSGTISGLNARNIGSAAMSGRIALLRLCLTALLGGLLLRLARR